MDGKVIVDEDATVVDLTKLTDVPEGYEVIMEESIPEITYGWIYVELRRIES